jgi:perosamine synthetase
MQEFTDHPRFGIGFDHRDRERLHALWEEILDTDRWTQGEMTRRFEEAWAAWNGLGSVATSGWTGAAMAALTYAGVHGEAVLCPSNTFMATPLAIVNAGARPVFVDCNRQDLCASLESFEAALRRHRPKAAFLVHIGGHIAFDVDAIADLCRSEGVFLIEDCAHAHGAQWRGKRPGSWGDAGVWSFYATKTISTGEGGMLVSRHVDLLEYARAYIDYGKPSHEVPGLNFRMSEFTAALGLVQVERLEEIVAWKNAVAREILDPAHPSRLELPNGMVSGFYKYIVFDPIERSTGKVYDQPCHRIMGTGDDLPDSDWVALHHWCVPLYYRPAGEAQPSRLTEVIG